MSLFGLERTVGGKLEAGYGMKVGGGLSSSPHLAQTLPIFLRPDQALAAAHYATVVYRDFGYREKRNKARFKFLVADWGAEKVLAQMEELSGIRFDRHSEFHFPVDPETDHIGIHEQKQAGLYFVGVCFAGGRVRGSQARTIAALARKYAAPGQDFVRATNKQNLILLNIPEKNLDALKAELDAAGPRLEPSNFRQGCVSCTGIEFCNLAIAETKNRMIELVGQLEAECADYKGEGPHPLQRLPQLVRPAPDRRHRLPGRHDEDQRRLHPVLRHVHRRQAGRRRRFNELVKNKIPATDIHKTVGKLLRHFEANRQPGEIFADFAKRVPKDEIKKALEPEPAA